MSPSLHVHVTNIMQPFLKKTRDDYTRKQVNTTCDYRKSPVTPLHMGQSQSSSILKPLLQSRERTQQTVRATAPGTWVTAVFFMKALCLQLVCNTHITIKRKELISQKFFG